MFIECGFFHDLVTEFALDQRWTLPQVVVVERCSVIVSELGVSLAAELALAVDGRDSRTQHSRRARPNRWRRVEFLE